MLAANELEKTGTSEINGDCTSEINGDCLHKEDTKKTGAAAGNELEKTVTIESNGDSSHKEDTNKTVTVANELGNTGTVASDGDSSHKDDSNKTGDVGNKLENKVTNKNIDDSSHNEDDPCKEDRNKDVDVFTNETNSAGSLEHHRSTNEIKSDKEVREDKIGNDIIIETDMGDSCEIVNDNSEIKDREEGDSPIQEVTYEKNDTCNSESHGCEQVKSGDGDSSDEDNLPLSELKVLSSKENRIGQGENLVYFTSDADSSLEGNKVNEERDRTIVDHLIESLKDTEDNDSHPISMEEYRLRYTKDFVEASIIDEETIIQETRNEVDRSIFAVSDTTATSDCSKDDSDSEPEMVIYRKGKRTQKKKTDLSR